MAKYTTQRSTDGYYYIQCGVMTVCTLPRSTTREAINALLKELNGKENDSQISSVRCPHCKEDLTLLSDHTCTAHSTMLAIYDNARGWFTGFYFANMRDVPSFDHERLLSFTTRKDAESLLLYVKQHNPEAYIREATWAK